MTHRSFQPLDREHRHPGCGNSLQGRYSSQPSSSSPSATTASLTRHMACKWQYLHVEPDFDGGVFGSTCAIPSRCSFTSFSISAAHAVICSPKLSFAHFGNFALQPNTSLEVAIPWTSLLPVLRIPNPSP